MGYSPYSPPIKSVALSSGSNLKAAALESAGKVAYDRAASGLLSAKTCRRHNDGFCGMCTSRRARCDSPIKRLNSRARCISRQAFCVEDRKGARGEQVPWSRIYRVLGGRARIVRNRLLVDRSGTCDIDRQPVLLERVHDLAPALCRMRLGQIGVRS